LCMTKLRVLVLCFHYFLWINSIVKTPPKPSFFSHQIYYTQIEDETRLEDQTRAQRQNDFKNNSNRKKKHTNYNSKIVCWVTQGVTIIT
jgi:hypothetical protein